MNVQRQFMFTGATMPKKIFNRFSREFLRQKVKQIEFVESDMTHHISRSVEFDWIYDQDEDP